MRLSDKLTDLDFAILALLPNEGARYGNHTFGKQVVPLREELRDATSGQIQGRLRSMRGHGLTKTVVVQPTNAGMGWQRTALGVQVLSERRAVENTPPVELPKEAEPEAKSNGNGVHETPAPQSSDSELLRIREMHRRDD
jgi:hypothetical protein